MHELAKITGIRPDIEGTEMKSLCPEKKSDERDHGQKNTRCRASLR